MTGKQLFELLQKIPKLRCSTNTSIFSEALFSTPGGIVDVSFVSMGEDDASIYKIRLDGTAFLAHNHTLATADWYDSRSIPCLKYFETRHFRSEIEDLYVNISDEYDCGLDVCSESKLQTEYLDFETRRAQETPDVSPVSYVEWLETELERARVNISEISDSKSSEASHKCCGGACH